jgi:arginine deiminase
MDHQQLVPVGPQELAQRQQELVQHLNQVQADNTRLHDTVANSNSANADRFTAIIDQMSSQSVAQRDQAEKLERVFSLPNKEDYDIILGVDDRSWIYSNRIFQNRYNVKECQVTEQVLNKIIDLDNTNFNYY